MARYFVRYYRELQELSRPELASRAGMSARRLSNLERGKTAWKMSDLERCAAALGLTLADLYGPDDPPGKAPHRAAAGQGPPAETHLIPCLCGGVTLCVVIAPRRGRPEERTPQDACHGWSLRDGQPPHHPQEVP